MLTRAGWAVVAGSAAALGTGRLLGTEELFVLGATGVALVVAALLWVRRPAATPSLVRQVVPRRPMVGAPARVEVTARNLGTRSTPAATIVDQVDGTIGARLLLGPLRTDAVRQVGYRLPTSRRGRVGVGPLRVELSDPFGLARRSWRAQERIEVTILPAVEALSSERIGEVGDEPLATVAPRAHASRGIADPATLRPYVVGDDLRRVHWPTSARLDELVVRRDEERRQGHLTVVLETARWTWPPAFEQAVSAAASLVHAAAEAGDRVRILTTEGYDSGPLDARRGEASLLEVLAHVEPGAAGAGAATAISLPARAGLVVVLAAATEAGATGGAVHGSAPGSVTVAFGGPPGSHRPAAASEVHVPDGASFAAAWRAAHEPAGVR